LRIKGMFEAIEKSLHILKVYQSVCTSNYQNPPHIYESARRKVLLPGDGGKSVV